MHNIKIKQWNYNERSLELSESLYQSLGVEEAKIISFLGTSQCIEVMYQLACEMKDLKKRIVITSHGEVASEDIIEDAHFIQLDDWEQLQDDDLVVGVNLVGKLVDNKHIERPNGSIPFEKAELFLVQAEESNGYAVKVLKEEEPKIELESDMVVICLGMDAVGKTFEEGCYQFNTCGDWLRREADDLITEEDMMLLIVDNRGYRKVINCRDGIKYRVVLNRVRKEVDIDNANKVIQRVPAFMRDECVVLI